MNQIVRFVALSVSAMGLVFIFQNCGGLETPTGNPQSDSSSSVVESKDCAATVQNNCELQTSSSGSGSGNCANGFVGVCSYSCQSGAWTQATNACVQAFQFTATISSNLTNYNLRAAAVAAGWNQSLPVSAEITIAANAIVTSSAVASAAFLTGTFPAGSIIKIINNGSIRGAGVATYGDKSNNQAWEGGNALQIDTVTTIINNGTIIGGAGGGGQEDMDSCCSVGNGGSAGGRGGSAIVFNAGATVTNTGSIFGAGGGGASGGGAYSAGVASGRGGHGEGSANGVLQIAQLGQTSGICAGGAGGNGGAFGLPGLGGGNCGNGAAAGGAGGYAMVLNGNTVTYNTAAVVSNSSYTTTTWLNGTKGRIAP